MSSTTRITQLNKNQTQQPIDSSPVRITGEKRNADDTTALHKIARACIALARHQLAQEQKDKPSETAPITQGGGNA